MKIDRKNNVNVGIPEFYTIQEVARALKVTERALYIWKDEGKITFTKFGKSNRISREELERFIAAGTEQKKDANKKPTRKNEFHGIPVNYISEPDKGETRSRRVQLLVKPSIYNGIREIAYRKRQSVNNLIEEIFSGFLEDYESKRKIGFKVAWEGEHAD